jgi:PAS domain S-box-containing protein
VETREAFLAAIDEYGPELIVSDFKMPQFDGLAALKLALERCPDVPFIMVTGSMNEDTAVECMKAGAWDYVIKEHVKRLGAAVRAALERQRVRLERQRALAALTASEALTRGILENVQDAYVRVDLDGRILMVSPSAVGLYGYGSMEEMIGLPTMALYATQEERPRVLEELKLHGSLRDIVGQGRKKDGTIFWVSLNARFFKNEQGKVAGAECFARDISEREQVADRLRASEERYKQLVDNTDTGFVVIDDKGVVVSANEPYVRLAGAKRTEDVVGHSVTEWTAPDQRENNAQAVALCARQGSIQDFETVYQSADGTRVEVTINATVEETAEGGKRLASLCRDITARKRADEKLRRSEAEYRGLFDNAIMGISQASPDGRLIRVNQAYARMYGYCSPEALITAVDNVGRLYANPDDRALVMRILAEKGVMEPREVPVIRRDGSRLVVLVSAREIRDISGNLVCYQAEHVDVTARRRAEESLRESERKYRSLHESLIDAVASVDLAGHILEFNGVFGNMLGYSAEEIHRLTYSDITPARWHASEAQIIAEQVLKRGYSDVYEKECRRKDGTIVPVELRTFLVRDEAGAPTGMWAIVRDITERKRTEAERENLEQQLRLSQRLESVGSLAGGIAHDFNNLLSVILCCTDFALGRVTDDDRARDELLEVKKAGERAVALTRQLLAFSRKQVLQPVVLDLNQIAAGVEKMLRRILGEDIDYVQVLAPDLGVVRADPGQIEQVLMNLVVNARDAMPTGGKLTIETCNVDLDEEYAARHVATKPGAYVRLVVSDTGCGMDAATQARVFEPFFTTKEKGKGTGLGLSTVYGIVKQSGGNIWVYSEPGQGTTFKIYLPRVFSAEKTVTGSRLAAVPDRATGTETILVVDDEKAIRHIAKGILGAAGYTVLTAAAASNALLTSKAHQGKIHLLLTDVVMPHVSGRALAESLAVARPGIKVLYMSGYTDDAIVHHGTLDPGTHFIGKPFSGADLTKKVREVLDSGMTKPADGHEQAIGVDAETKEQSPDGGALRTLSPDTRNRLREAVLAARYDEIVVLIENVRITHPNLATELRRMADLFDYDGMRAFLD